MKLEDLVHMSSPGLVRILEILPIDSRQALLATSNTLRHGVHQFATGICIIGEHLDTKLLIKTPFPCLRRLSITSSYATSEDIVEVAQAKWPLLDSLKLALDMSGEQLKLLLASMDRPNLHSLNLSHNKWDIVSTSSLAHSNWTMLSHLALCGASLDAAAIAEVIGGNFPLLSVLKLDYNALGSQAMAHLSQGSWPHLKCLSLRGNDLDANAINHLIKGNWPLLSVLRLDVNALDSQAMAHLTQGSWPYLKYLSLRENALEAIAINRLMRGNWPLLEHVDLFCNHIGDEGIRAVVQGNWTNLQILDVGRNYCVFGACILSAGNWPLLRELKVADVFYPPAFISSLKGSWPLLEKLDLSGKLLNDDMISLLFGVDSIDLDELIYKQPRFDGQLTILKCPVHKHWPSLTSVTLAVHLPRRNKSIALFVSCV